MLLDGETKGMRRLLDLGWIYRRGGDECRIICVHFYFWYLFWRFWIGGEHFVVFTLWVLTLDDMAWMDALVVGKIRTDARDGLHMHVCRSI
jgi:hypothetical protein